MPSTLSLGNTVSDKTKNLLNTLLTNPEMIGDDLSSTLARLDAFRELVASKQLPTLAPLLPLLFNLQGKPYTLREHFPFEAFYQTTMTREIVFKTARQVSKSTNIAAKSILLCNAIPDFAILSLTPQYEQIRRFSTQYVRPFIENSPVKNHWVGTTTENSVLMRTFKNRSRMFFSFAMLSCDRVRGIAASAVSIDESVIGSSRVVTREGYKQIKDIKQGDTLLSYDCNGRLCWDVAVRPASYHGRRHCYRLTTEHGTSIIGTEKHWLPTTQGWKRIRDIADACKPGKGNTHRRRVSIASGFDVGRCELELKGKPQPVNGYFSRDKSTQICLGKNRDIVQVYYEKGFDDFCFEGQNPKLGNGCEVENPISSGIQVYTRPLLRVQPGEKTTRKNRKCFMAVFAELARHCFLGDGRRRSKQKQLSFKHSKFFKSRSRFNSELLQRKGSMLCKTGNCKREIPRCHFFQRQHIKVKRQNSALRIRVFSLQGAAKCFTKSNPSLRLLQEKVHQNKKTSKTKQVGFGRFLRKPRVCEETQKLSTKRKLRQKEKRLPGDYLNSDSTVLCYDMPTTGNEAHYLQPTSIQSIEYYGFEHVYDIETAVNRAYFIEDIASSNCQDMDASFIPIIKETMGGPASWRIFMATGTPKTLDNTIHGQWSSSSQAEWCILCPRCKKLNVPAMGYDLEKMIGPDNPDIGPNRPGVICAKCSLPIDPRTGRWVHKYDHLRWKFPGYHIPQIIMPMHYADRERWNDILAKQRGYGHYTTSQFYNEVLGESYDVGTKLVNETDLRKAAVLPWQNNPDNVMEIMPHLRSYDLLILAVDWGGGGEDQVSFTTCAVMGWRPDGKIDVVYGKRLLTPHDHIREAKEILQIFNQFSCHLMCHDYTGAGSLRETLIIQAGVPSERIVPISYVAAARQNIMVFREASEFHPRNYYQVDKTRSLVLTCACIKMGQLRFFQYDYVSNDNPGLLYDFLALVENKIPTRAGSDLYTITRSSMLSDDFAQAVNIGCCTIWYRTQTWPNLAELARLQITIEQMRHISPDTIDWGEERLSGGMSVMP